MRGALAAGVDEKVMRLQAIFTDVYNYLAQSRTALEQAEQFSLQARTALDGLDYELRVLRQEVEALDATATVLQRSLSLFEELGPKPEHGNRLVSITANLLELSFDLVSTAFPAEQLAFTEFSERTHEAELLRARWRSWLERMSAYLSKVVPMTHRLGQSTGDSLDLTLYRQAWAELTRQCCRLAESQAESLPRAHADRALVRLGSCCGGPLGQVKVLPARLGAWRTSSPYASGSQDEGETRANSEGIDATEGPAAAKGTSGEAING